MVEVKTDPRIKFSMDNLKAKSEYLDRIMSKIEIATKAADRIRDAEKTIDLIEKRIKEMKDSQTDSLNKKIKAAKDSLKSLMGLINEPEVQGIRDNSNTLMQKLSTVYEYVSSSFDAPGKNADEAMLPADQSLKETVERVNSFFETKWKYFENSVKETGISFFDKFEPIKY